VRTITMTANKKDLYNLADGWLELESDPGLFTLLMEDMGVHGVQVEEIYDLQREPLVEKKPCYGAIFLFRWIEDRRSRRKIVEEEDLYVKDEDEVNKIFFAQQMIPNSCATHALVSILLNCPQLNLGLTLSNLRNHVQGMNPENKGLAIGNCAELAQAHNSHAVPRARRRFEKGNGPSTGSRYTGEAFHFVSYVPINNRLYELDGLRKYPIDHGPIPDPDNWTEKLREVITERLGIPQGDIRFALMALVPDSRVSFQRKLQMLRCNREVVIIALRQLLEICRNKKAETSVKLEDPGVSREPGVSKDSGVSKDPSTTEDECMVVNEQGVTLEVEELARDVLSVMSEGAHHLIASRLKQTAAAKIKNKPLLRVSRGSSFDSQPKSPFQSNPLLTAHDYSKSPMMEGFDDVDDDVVMDQSLPDDIDDGNTEPIQAEDKGFPSESDPEKPAENSGSSSDTLRTEDRLEGENAGSGVIRTEDHVGPGNDVNKKVEDNSVRYESSIVSEDTAAKDCLSGAQPSRGETSSGNPVETKLFSLSLEETKPEFDPQESQLPEPHRFSPKDLLGLLRRVETEIYMTESALKDEVETHKKFIVDDCRRVHNYDEFINTFISMLAEQNMLADLVEHGMGYRRLTPATGDGTSKKAVSDGASKKAVTAEGSSKKETAIGPKKPTVAETSKPFKKTVSKGGPTPKGGGRRKKKRFEDSESDWSDDDRDIPAPIVKPSVKVLYNDSSLPKGWKRKVKKRPGTGLVNSKYDVVIIGPEGDQFKSRAELRAFLDLQDFEMDADEFDFSVTGTKRSNVKYATKKRK